MSDPFKNPNAPLVKTARYMSLSMLAEALYEDAMAEQAKEHGPAAYPAFASLSDEATASYFEGAQLLMSSEEEPKHNVAYSVTTDDFLTMLFQQAEEASFEDQAAAYNALTGRDEAEYEEGADMFNILTIEEVE